MSKLKPARLRCAVCTASSEQLIAEAEASFEPPDFDTRPGKPSRSSIIYWVQSCPDCGYCAHDLSVAAEETREFVRGAFYQAFHANKAYPGKATEFLSYALLLEHLGFWSDAGWTALHAAWVCDDLKQDEHAVNCRRRAVELWKHAKRHGQDIMDNDFEEFALVCDIHRRSQEWDESRAAANEGLECDNLSSVVDALLRRELALIDRRDPACHNMRELRRA
jgi:hypothetical protein